MREFASKSVLINPEKFVTASTCATHRSPHINRSTFSLKASHKMFWKFLRTIPPAWATAFCADRKAHRMPETTSVLSPQSVSQRIVLHSWKDIANYTGRGVRTIQRYECEHGFPIHRPAGKSRSAVLAFSDEVDEWLGKPPMAATVPFLVQMRLSTADQIRERREWLAVAANAKRSRECAQTMYDGCKLQARRVEEMIERVKAARLRLSNRPVLIG